MRTTIELGPNTFIDRSDHIGLFSSEAEDEAQAHEYLSVKSVEKERQDEEVDRGIFI